MEKKEWELSTNTIFKIILAIVGLWFLIKTIDILILFFMVLVIVAALSPVVDRWSLKMPRVIAVLLVYLLILLVIGGSFSLIIPPLVEQLTKLAQDLPHLLDKVSPFYESVKNALTASSETLGNLSSHLSKLSSNLYQTTLGFISGVVAIFTILVLSFYLLMEKDGATKLIAGLLPLNQKEKVADVFQKIGLKMGAWLRGQIVLALIVGVLVLIGLWLIQIPFPLALAVWAAFTELIPYIGPILGAIPAIIIGFLISPLTGILTILIYVIIQQIEANFLVPKVMQKAVGLSPVVIILALLIGGKLLGFLGVIIAIPAAAAFQVFLQEWPKFKKVDG
ncbi:AI-2E family transporter [Candidatus Berkelbacteria bacterium]|nr:AI-2E family transporter [Candidatus Berkelbacteria bacterium]MBI4029805.1 AI-2E family transporter [Candidatus Berkelbacteria bacterium]